MDKLLKHALFFIQDCMVKFPWIEKSLRKFGQPMFDSLVKVENMGQTGEFAVEVHT